MSHLINAWEIDPKVLVITLRDDTYTPVLMPDKTQLPFVNGIVKLLPVVHLLTFLDSGFLVPVMYVL